MVFGHVLQCQSKKARELLIVEERKRTRVGKPRAPRCGNGVGKGVHGSHGPRRGGEGRGGARRRGSDTEGRAGGSRVVTLPKKGWTTFRGWRVGRTGRRKGSKRGAALWSRGQVIPSFGTHVGLELLVFQCIVPRWACEAICQRGVPRYQGRSEKVAGTVATTFRVNASRAVPLLTFISSCFLLSFVFVSFFSSFFCGLFQLLTRIKNGKRGNGTHRRNKN